MKLIRLKLLSEFRGLPKNFEVKFKNNKITPTSIDPICLIGLNGSGKSNLLEVLAEIFYFLEKFSQAKKIEIKHFKKKFGFEIEYSLSRNVFNTNKYEKYEEAREYQLKILIEKKPKKSPIAKAWDEELKYEFINEDPSIFKSYLPNHVIAYSSGMNELISNPFIKMDFQYLDEFEKLVKGTADLDDKIESQMFFMDYDANKLITICNFLFDKTFDKSKLGIKNLNSLKRELKIKELHSFSLSLKLRDNNKKAIKLPSFLNLAIEDLKKCATLFNEKEFRDYSEYEFYFYVNDATKKLFKRYFKTANELYKIFYFFRLLNNRLITKKTRDTIKEADEKVNISALLPKFEEELKVFTISDIAFMKKNIKKPVYYKQLSDGEHQFLHVFGILLLMDRVGTLFLMDEPETHFNPDWRSKFVSTLNESLFDEEVYEDIFREQELILTTHSPFIVSDCKKENVYKFSRNSRGKIQIPENPDFETFGTSVEMIYWNIFKKHQSISDVAFSELEEIKNKINDEILDKEGALKELSRFGDSFEKMNIISILKEKYNK